MNNDISRLNVGVQNAKNHVSNSVNKSQMSPMIDYSETKQAGDSRECLGAMGYAQVNMGNSETKKTVKKSMEKLIQNPEYVQAHVELCDALVAKGYPLEVAIEKSDMFFGALKNKNIYS